MNRRPFVLAALALSAVACSSDPPADGRDGFLGGASEASDAAIRDQVARAAILAHRGTATGANDDAAWTTWEGNVKTWSRALDHAAICRALDAHRGKSRLYWGVGVDLGGVDREIVVDVTKREAAVFTYATSGVRNVLDPKVTAYQLIATSNAEQRPLVEAWTLDAKKGEDLPSGIDLGADARSWTASDGTKLGRVSSLAPAGAAALTAFASVDGSTYGYGAVPSNVGTRALSKAMAFEGHSLTRSPAGDAITMNATATAAAILRWAGPHNGAAVQAAIVAAAIAVVDTRHGGNIDAYCGAVDAPLKGLSLAAAVLALDDLPEPPKDAATEAAATPDCANDDELSCNVLYPGQKKVCAINGTQHCCIDEAPVTQVCQKHDDCKTLSATAQCVQVQNAPADGRFFTCQEPSPGKCAAIKNPRPLDDDGQDVCDESGLWPRIWEGELCGKIGAKWRARCFVKNSQCQSDARSCLEGAQAQRWDTDYSACGNAGGRYKESFGRGVYVTGVCCNK